MGHLSLPSGAGAVEGEESIAEAKERLSEMSPEELQGEYAKRVKELEKLASMQARLERDLKSMEEKTDHLRQDIKQFDNIEATKKEIEKQKHASSNKTKCIMFVK